MFLLVKKICFVRPNLLEKIPDIEEYNVDVFVVLEDGYISIVVIVTAKNILSLMDKEKNSFLESAEPFISVRKLKNQLMLMQKLRYIG